MFLFYAFCFVIVFVQIHGKSKKKNRKKTQFVRIDLIRITTAKMSWQLPIESKCVHSNITGNLNGNRKQFRQMREKLKNKI